MRKRKLKFEGVPRLGFTLDEYAAALGVGKSTVHAEIRDGHLKKTKVRNRSIILASDAEAHQEYLAAKSRTA
jgi:excisionase family DNA binding protein